jgi:hypothetical protein
MTYDAGVSAKHSGADSNKLWHHNPAMEYSIWTMHSQNPCIFTDNKAEVAMRLQNRTGTTTEEEIELRGK